MSNDSFTETMQIIVDAIKERGFDPYAQLCGYLWENDLTYITSHNGARDLIQQLDKNKLTQYLHTLSKE